MSTYQSTLDYLYSQLPQYQKIGGKAYKSDLSNIIEICSILENPQEKIKTIHIAGTNGKGSTSHLIASVLQEAGYKVGLYTSPHLKDFRERVRINGESISKQEVIDFVNQHRHLLEHVNPSFFEWTVGLAFYHFHQEKTDINIIETGLGGRLDSTNILTPELSVITNISLEHTALLGDTIELIAKEKGGIIKQDIPVVIGKSNSITKPIFENIAKKNNSTMVFSEDSKYPFFEIGLKGEIQQENAKTCVSAIQILRENEWSISDKNISEGLINVVKNTHLLGRFQIIEENPTIVVDTAHNEDGIESLMTEISKIKHQKLHVVIGMANDKNHEVILKSFPKKTKFYFCSSTNERVLKGKQLKGISSSIGISGKSFKSVAKGLKKALKNAKEADFIVVTGSNFIVADII